jgi:hypothetical protein
MAHAVPAFSEKKMVGATGLEPATPCTPFPQRHFPQIRDIQQVFDSLLDFT